jgi:hypothetical protein
MMTTAGIYVRVGMFVCVGFLKLPSNGDVEKLSLFFLPAPEAGSGRIPDVGRPILKTRVLVSSVPSAVPV